jgi:capsular polysaccharide biosynthesis protein
MPAATQNKLECLLLTWHGTLLCTPPNAVGLSHKPLTDREALDRACRLTVYTELDLDRANLLPLPDASLPYESTTLGDGIATRAAEGRGFNFLRGTRFLCANGKGSDVDWNRERAQTWERFLPVPIELLVRLSEVHTVDWIHGGKRIPGRAFVSTGNFMFSMGSLDIDLTQAYPTFSPPLGPLPGENCAQSVFVPGPGDQIAEFTATREAALQSEEPLWLSNAESQPLPDATVESLDAPELKASEVLYYPPAFAHRDDRTFFVTKSWGGRPRLGFTTSQVMVRKARDCYVMLFRSLEGVVFDAGGGVRRGYGFLGASDSTPRELQTKADRHYLERQCIDEAPLLSGDYLVFYNGNLQNYYHWLVEAILSLYMLCKVRKEPFAIVLPASLAHISNLQYVESLKLFGFGDIPLTWCAAPLVRVESARWIATPHDPLADYPEHILREFQSFAAAAVGVAVGSSRLYVEREHLRQVENAEEVRAFLERAGFMTIRLEGLPIAAQVRLFASAEFVIGPHGAGLSNLLFAPPSARVIEFMPCSHMRPFFWLISSKLGHEYGMLRCDTDNGTFNGKLRVDLQKLARLLSLLEKA